MTASIALIQMVTKSAGSAMFNIKHHRFVLVRQTMSGPEILAVEPENVGYLISLPGI
jgi:hypothetical protein